MSASPFIAVDWGTSNLRAWRFDAAGAVKAGFERPWGVSRLGPGEAAARFEAEVRPALDGRDLPTLLCGMVGSTLGWTLAPYVDCPASPGRLAAALIEAAPGVRIVPGLRCAGLAGPDVMRGEETQILGWLAAEPGRTQGRWLLCLPGTHAKWVLVCDGVVERFATAMTGEMFELLGAHSILKLANQVEEPSAFDDGVAAAGDGGALLTRLFGLRGRTLNGQLPAASAGSFLSGLLIGAEIAGLLPLLGEAAGPVQLIGDTALTARYRRALARFGRTSETMDGEAAVLGGLAHIWRAAP